MRKYDDAEKIYRYCMKHGFRFNYNEDDDFINVTLWSSNSDKILSYTFSKDGDYILRLVIDDKEYKTVDEALRDFDEYNLLALR